MCVHTSRTAAQEAGIPSPPQFRTHRETMNNHAFRANTPCSGVSREIALRRPRLWQSEGEWFQPQTPPPSECISGAQLHALRTSNAPQSVCSLRSMERQFAFTPFTCSTTMRAPIHAPSPRKPRVARVRRRSRRAAPLPPPLAPARCPGNAVAPASVPLTTSRAIITRHHVRTPSFQSTRPGTRRHFGARCRRKKQTRHYVARKNTRRFAPANARKPHKRKRQPLRHKRTQNIEAPWRERSQLSAPLRYAKTVRPPATNTENRLTPRTGASPSRSSAPPPPPCSTPPDSGDTPASASVRGVSTNRRTPSRHAPESPRRHRADTCTPLRSAPSVGPLPPAHGLTRQLSDRSTR